MRKLFILAILIFALAPNVAVASSAKSAHAQANSVIGCLQLLARRAAYDRDFS